MKIQTWIFVLICATSALVVKGFSVDVDKIQSQESNSSLAVSGRISGGTIYNRNDFRFVAKLEATFRPGPTLVCSGVVLTTRIILTVAHCVIRVGQIKASSVVATLPHGKSYTFNQGDIVIEPNYHYMFGTDIALLRKRTVQQSQPFMTNFGIPPRIPEQRMTILKPVVTEAFVAGWGLKEGSNDYSRTLQVGRVTIMTSNECETIYYPELANSMQQGELLCTERTSFAGICDGDWGGPLLGRSGTFGEFTLLGLSIFTESHCDNVNRMPNAFMNVEAVGAWLRNELSKFD